MKIQHLQGLIAAPFTPMHKDGSLNLSLIPDYYRMLKVNGITGAFICGSTGEGVSMTAKEKMSIAEAWAACSKNDPDFKVMTLLGGTSIADCKELALHAEGIGLFGISFTAPFAPIDSAGNMFSSLPQSISYLPLAKWRQERKSMKSS